MLLANSIRWKLMQKPCSACSACSETHRTRRTEENSSRQSMAREVCAIGIRRTCAGFLSSLGEPSDHSLRAFQPLPLFTLRSLCPVPLRPLPDLCCSSSLLSLLSAIVCLLSFVRLTFWCVSSVSCSFTR